ncbi:hypothetical protein [Ornithinibacillus xuwenensis]|uniref:Replication protein n=1 Tax=Ornithinibacillus xuwenensis TaxID=3144668 RepID=A0ABU9XBL7_9BACI
METWFKVYRKVFESDLWHDVSTFRLFLFLVGQASHKDGIKVAGIELNKGQFLRSYRKLAEDLSYKEGRGTKQYSTKTIKKSVDKLVSDGMVSIVETKQGTLFTVLNYSKYQDLKDIEIETVNGSVNEGETNGKRRGNNNKNYRIKELKNKDKKNNSRKQVYDTNSIYYQLAIFFFEQIKINNPNHKEPNFQTWSDEIRKMIELDNRTEEQVRYLMKWVQQDEFEMANVLSPAKLRKRFDSLVLKVKRQNPTSKVVPIDKNKKTYNYGF